MLIFGTLNLTQQNARLQKYTKFIWFPQITRVSKSIKKLQKVESELQLLGHV
jgi:hypothetical protein